MIEQKDTSEQYTNFHFNSENAFPRGDDPIVQKSASKHISAETILNFEGIKMSDNSAPPTPPDTDGDIGKNYYFQMVNVMFEIFDKKGNSAAFYAISFNNIEGLELLLQHGIICESQNRRGLTVLHFACRFQDEVAIKLILKYSKSSIFSIKDFNQSTPLQVATKKCDFNILIEILEAMNIIYHKNVLNQTELAYVIKKLISYNRKNILIAINKKFGQKLTLILSNLKLCAL